MFKSNLQKDNTQLTATQKELEVTQEQLKATQKELEATKKKLEVTQEQLESTQEKLIEHLQKENNESEIEILLKGVPLEKEEEAKLLNKIKEVMVTVFSKCEGPHLKIHLFLTIQEMIHQLTISTSNSIQSEKEISEKIAHLLQHIVHAIIDELPPEVKWVTEKNHCDKVCLVKIKPLDFLGIIRMEFKPEEDEAYLDKQNRFIQMIFGIILDEGNKNRDTLSLLKKCAQDLGILSSYQNVSSLSLQNQKDNTTDDSKAKFSSFSQTKNPTPSQAASNVVKDNSNFFSFAPYISLCKTNNKLCIDDIKLTKNTDHSENFACSFLVKYLPESQRYKFYTDDFTSYSFTNLMRASLLEKKPVSSQEEDQISREYVYKIHFASSKSATECEKVAREGQKGGVKTIAEQLEKETSKMAKSFTDKINKKGPCELSDNQLPRSFFEKYFQQLNVEMVNNLKNFGFGKFSGKYSNLFQEIANVEYKINRQQKKLEKKQQKEIEKYNEQLAKETKKVVQLEPLKKEEADNKLKKNAEKFSAKLIDEQKQLCVHSNKQRKALYKKLEEKIYASKDLDKDQLAAKADFDQYKAELNLLCDLNFFIVSHPKNEFEVSKTGMTATLTHS